MKTIQEIAIEKIPDAFDSDEILPARAGHLVNLERRGFIEGAAFMKSALTRWRDPKKELPDYYHTVLIKYLKDGLYTHAAAWLSVSDDDKYLWTIAETNILISDRNVHGWRPIYNL